MASSREGQSAENVSLEPETGNDADAEEIGNLIDNKMSALMELEDRRSLRKRAQHFLLTSKIGIGLEILNTLLSLLSCSLFIVQSYYEDAEHAELQNRLDLLDLVITFYFLVDYIMQVYVSESRIHYIFSGPSFIDLITIFPPMVILLPKIVGFGTSDGLAFLDLSFLRFIRVLKVLRILRLQRLLGNSDSEVQRQIFTVSLTVLSIIFCFAGLFHVLERTFVTPEQMLEVWEVDSLAFHDAIYFTVVTISTVGYGDFVPISVPSKFLVMVMIATTIIIISKQTNKLLTLMSLKSVYARNSYSTSSNTPHVLVVGHIDFTSLQTFLTEFFHEDHGQQETNIVIISPNLPTAGVEWLLRSPDYAFRTHYLQGSVMREKDLHRAASHKANALFVLGDKFSCDPHGQDATGILSAIAVLRFAADMGCQHLQPIIQLQRPDNKHNFTLSGFNASNSDSQILCIDEIKLGLLAKNCLCPGFSTMVSNLFSSSSLEPDPSMPKWMAEYVCGAGLEIYRTPLSPHFEGTSFDNIANTMYHELGVTIFAVEVTDSEGQIQVVLFPSQFVIPSGVCTNVYVIAEDKAAADELTAFGTQQEDGTGANVPSAAAHLREVKRSKRQISRSMQPTAYEVDQDARLRKMQQSYHIVEKPRSLEECTLPRATHLSGHIIVTGSVQGLFYVIGPLRSRYITQTQSIVVLRPSPPVDWDDVALFPDVYYVQGSPLEPVDLVRAGVLTATKAVSLSNVSMEAGDENGETKEHLVDADSIFTYQGIVKSNSDCSVTCELVNPSNIHFLLQGDEGRNAQSHSSFLSPAYASGNVFLPIVLDRLSCQAYYNKYLLTILQELILVGGSSLARFNEHDNVTTAELYQIPVPRQFVGATYGALLRWLVLQQSMLPLALYRAPSGFLKNSKPYVLTNPARNTQIASQDLVFVLSATSPDLNQDAKARAEESGPVSPLHDGRHMNSLIPPKDNGTETSGESTARQQDKLPIENLEDANLRSHMLLIMKQLHSDLAGIQEGLEESRKQTRQQTSDLRQRLAQAPTGVAEDAN